jgi:hypothetical protein
MVFQGMTEAKRRRIDPLKVVFALGYMLQGLASPFQGITILPFYDHLHVHYGLGAGALQQLFAKSYLAWSFKPIIGFLFDAYGRTRTLLIGLLALAAAGFLVTPVLDTGPVVFFGLMFGLSVVFAGTDVAIDRATVIAGDEEAKTTGRSKASTVGLNQAICWLSIYGTGFVAAVAGGWVSEHLRFNVLLVALAGVPLLVLLFVLRLPRDTGATIPLKRSIAQFWSGLNSGSVLGIMVFFFLFHCQPRFEQIFTNYALDTLHFSRTQLGFGTGAGYAGYFSGVLLFMWKGVRWQERFGLRKLFRIYIVVGAVVSLASLVLLDPRFSAITAGLSRLLPFLNAGTVRLAFLCAVMAFVAAGDQMIRMSTFSLVGAVVPVAAAGSLFAGFMSVANLGYSFAEASGGWLYDKGMSVPPLRGLQRAVFGMGGAPADKLSIDMIVLIGSLAYFASFIAVHLLPGREATLASGGAKPMAGPERWLVLPAGLRRTIDWGAVVIGAAVIAGLVVRAKVDPVASVLATFLGVCLVRKSLLDALSRRRVTA